MHKTHYLDVTRKLSGRKSACLEFFLSLSSEMLKLSDVEESLVVRHADFTLEDTNTQRVLRTGCCELE